MRDTHVVTSNSRARGNAMCFLLDYSRNTICYIQKLALVHCVLVLNGPTVTLRVTLGLTESFEVHPQLFG